MSRVVFSNGEEPSYTKLNQVADQCVITGNTAPSSPTEGMTWYDTNAAHPLWYVYNGTDWWPMPAGLIEKNTIANTGTGGAIQGTVTTINSSDVTFTAEADQRYCYEANVLIQCTDADNIFTFQLQSWDGSTWTDTEDPFYHRAIADDLASRVSIRTIDGPGAGAAGWRIRVVRYFGTGGAEIVGGTDVTVSHIGSSTLV